LTKPSRVTLQVNLAPSDLPTARYTVPHQLRQWAGQVDEVLLTLDLHRSPGRFAEAWNERLPGLTTLIAEWCERYPIARLVNVDYSTTAMVAVSNSYFGGEAVPAKDHRGAPFYAYFFGLNAAKNDFVLHMDSDMMFGGGSQAWLAEALGLMETDRRVVACNPLPGPPTPDLCLRSQQLAPYPLHEFAFQTTGFSTRIFLVDRQRFGQSLAPLPLSKARGRKVIGAMLDGHRPYETAELVIARAMKRHHLIRVDFLGRGGGMWAVHPLYRTPRFYDRLPSLIADIEAGRVADGQRGDHELNESMVDWTGARVRWHSRVGNHLRLAVSRLRPGVT
jgi:hypothetical protein